MARPLTTGLCTAVVAVSMACLSSAAAQSSLYPKGSATQPDPNSGLMKLDVVVTDQQGRPIAGLGEKDLTLLDNGQPRDIVSFQAFDNATYKPDPPVEIILVIDEVDLPAELLGSVEQAAQKFLLQNGGHLAHPVRIYRISKEGLFASAQPTTDGDGLAKEVVERKKPRQIWLSRELGTPIRRDPHNSTRILPPSFLFNKEWSELPRPLIALGSIAIEERRTPERKLMFWFGSGWPVKQGHWEHLFETVTELSTRLREARIGLWVADFWRQTEGESFPNLDFHRFATSEKSVNIGDLALQVLAVQSGGGELEGESEPAEPIIQSVLQANSFYTITFDPPRTDVVDEYHDLKVEVGKPELIAQTRTGYYNEPVYYDQPAGLKKVTVAQLWNSMKELRSASDSEAARRLKAMELSERLSSKDLAGWLLMFTGKKAMQALTAMADQSVMLSPPAAEILNLAPPSIKDQQQIIQRTVGYLSKTIQILPNLNAVQTTTLYLKPPRARGQTWKADVGEHSLDPVRMAQSAIKVSKGKEITQEISSSVLRKGYEDRSLQTEGTFGPILSLVIVGVAKPQSKLQWGRWEKGDDGPLAVFRYTISEKTPIFHVGFCCMAVDHEQPTFETDSPTFGEITVDPKTGAILRITIRADLSWRLPLHRSDIMVEYGPVILGERSYICPFRTVAISRQRSVAEVSEFGERFKVYAPFETILNDARYENYHLFRTSSRVLPGFIETPETK